MAEERSAATIPPVSGSLRGLGELRRAIIQNLRALRLLPARGATMSEERRDDELNEDGPGINGDLGSWLYVLCGIPMMIIFFVVLFALVGALDARNIMIPA